MRHRRLAQVVVPALVASILGTAVAFAQPSIGRTPGERPSSAQLPSDRPSPDRPAPSAFETSERVVALTFDDGAASTAQIVSILRARGARATFFVCGSRLGDGSEIASATANGFEIGNHTWSHVSLSGLPYPRATREIEATNDAVERLTGVRPRWVRSRGGLIDEMGMAAVRDSGQRHVNWDVHSYDTRWSLAPETIAAKVTRNAHPGAVVLMHATRPATILALPAIVSALQARGYVLVTVSTLADVAAGRMTARTARMAILAADAAADAASRRRARRISRLVGPR